MHTRFLAGLALGPDVYRTGWILTHQNGSQAGLSSTGREPGDFGGHLGPDGLSNRGSVENPGAHLAKSTARVSRITTTLI
jgi:hypothetical protein